MLELTISATVQELTDIQNEGDDRKIDIDRVGVSDLAFPLQVRDKAGLVQSTVATVCLAVDLPHHYKGTHMSRFIEVLNSHGSILDVSSVAAIPRELLGGLTPGRRVCSSGFRSSFQSLRRSPEKRG